jgi:hypothetical protein
MLIAFFCCKGQRDVVIFAAVSLPDIAAKPSLAKMSAFF